MEGTVCRYDLRLVVALAAGLVLVLAPQSLRATELALAQGTIAIHDAPAGEQSPACSQLVVEARSAQDNHLIGRTQPTAQTDGSCRYALSVVAQSAVWLRVRAALVAAERLDATSAAAGGAGAARDDRRVSSRAVALRWTVISPNTFFFAPGETKTISLSY